MSEGPDRGSAPRSWAPPRWAVWTESRSTSALVLTLDVVAALAAVALTILPAQRIVTGPVAAYPSVVGAAALVAAAVAHQEIVRRGEQLRRTVAAPRTVNFTAVWAFAAVVGLPSHWAVPVIVAVYAHGWLRLWRVRTPLYRTILTTSSVVLAAAAAHGFSALTTALLGRGDAGSLGSLLSVVGAMIVFAAVQQAVVVGVVSVAVPAAQRAAVRRVSADEYLIELATLSLGALVASVVAWQPLLVVLVPPPLVVLARATLVRELRRAAERDVRTGLLTAQAWRDRAEKLLAAPPRAHGTLCARRGPVRLTSTLRGSDRRQSGRRTSRRIGVCGVLMVDIDHFKAINDTFGHATGDVVLHRVAQALSAAVRDGDLVARYGGEEFLVLLTDPGSLSTTADDPARTVADTAERLRAHVAALDLQASTPDGPRPVGPVTVSVGAVAHRPGTDVMAMVAAADAAVYAAKRAGRDCVRLAAGRF